MMMRLHRDRTKRLHRDRTKRLHRDRTKRLHHETTRRLYRSLGCGKLKTWDWKVCSACCDSGARWDTTAFLMQLLLDIDNRQ
jgi:hypothetical protein